ncbi:TniQ family protein [Deinococcus sp.]|uniref:TniQ family protein n=1 Tax=Deinococcus sp. TaxID=47478 RepID=UPI0025C4CE72|nr:TniQ family protein [Deinococcus sp.]
MLPLRPRPYEGELLSSWVQRLAHANMQRLSYLTLLLTGDHDIWSHDPDRHLRPTFGQALSRATGTPLETIHSLTLGAVAGRVVPALPQQAPVRWIMPLYRRGYRRMKPGAAYCPACLAGAQAHVARHWRMSFATSCLKHGLRLLDCCPACAAPFAPLRNDLGRGQDWSLQMELPFAFCPDCGEDLRGAATMPADQGELALQQRLADAVDTGTMVWSGIGTVPSLEGFDVLHQLLTLILGRDAQGFLSTSCGLPGPVGRNERPNRSFEDYGLEDRRTLLAQMDWLISDWPAHLGLLCRSLKLTRRPLMVNFLCPPTWYDAVAETFSQANGRRRYVSPPLADHGAPDEFDRQAQQAPSASERRRWAILAAYARMPDTRAVCEALGVRAELVRQTVRRYNERGFEGVIDARRGSIVEKRRMLTQEQGVELQETLRRQPMSNAELADWIALRAGRRPDATTLWMYRRGVASHSLEGRRA